MISQARSPQWFPKLCLILGNNEGQRRPKKSGESIISKRGLELSETWGNSACKLASCFDQGNSDKIRNLALRMSFCFVLRGSAGSEVLRFLLGGVLSRNSFPHHLVMHKPRKLRLDAYSTCSDVDARAAGGEAPIGLKVLSDTCLGLYSAELVALPLGLMSSWLRNLPWFFVPFVTGSP